MHESSVTADQTESSVNEPKFCLLALADCPSHSTQSRYRTISGQPCTRVAPNSNFVLVRAYHWCISIIATNFESIPTPADPNYRFRFVYVSSSMTLNNTEQLREAKWMFVRGGGGQFFTQAPADRSSKSTYSHPLMFRFNQQVFVKIPLFCFHFVC